MTFYDTETEMGDIHYILYRHRDAVLCVHLYSGHGRKNFLDSCPQQHYHEGSAPSEAAPHIVSVHHGGAVTARAHPWWNL